MQSTEHKAQYTEKGTSTSQLWYRGWWKVCLEVLKPISREHGDCCCPSASGKKPGDYDSVPKDPTCSEEAPAEVQPGTIWAGEEKTKASLPGTAEPLVVISRYFLVMMFKHCSPWW